MDINEIFSKLGELLSYGEYDKVASVCERLVSTGYKEKEIRLVQFLAEAKVKDINDLPDSEEELDKLKSYSYIVSEFEPDMVNYVKECNDYIHSRKMSELDSLTKEDSNVTELVTSEAKSMDDLLKEESDEDDDVKIRTKEKDRLPEDDSDDNFGTPMKKIDTIGGDDDFEDNQRFSGGVDRFGGSEDRFSLEEDRFSPKSDRYENIGDEYNDQYNDQYGDQYGDQYSNQYGDQYDNYEDEEYDMPRSRKKKKDKRKERYNSFVDEYESQHGGQYEDQYDDQYGNQGYDQYGDQYDDDYDEFDEEGPAIDFILFIIAIVLGVADIASLIFALVSGAF